MYLNYFHPTSNINGGKSFSVELANRPMHVCIHVVFCIHVLFVKNIYICS